MPKKPTLSIQDPASTSAIELLTQLGSALKRQQRHFDDAVVTHCMQLIQDYREGRMQEHSVREPQAPYGGDKP